MSVESAIPCLGDVIANRYRLESLIGQGGMGLVYAARDSVLDRPVAIKILWGNAYAMPDAHARFKREARIASALRHPGAVEIHDFGSSDGRLYLAMELLEGAPLFDLISRPGGLGFTEIIHIGHQIADVLTAAHAVPFIHRDLKPENVFLDRRHGKERAVVLDFGLAFALEPEDESMGRLTRDNMTAGTPFYMSPEQACNKGLGPASDIYSLGCLLFEMCTGRPPFYDPAPAKVLTEHLYAPAPALRDFRPEAPTGLDELVARMLAKRKTERPTAEAVCRRLAALGPAALGARERGRDASYLSNRAARMVEAPTGEWLPSQDTGPELQPGAIHLAIVGPWDPQLAAALAVSGIETASIQGLARAAGKVDAIFAFAAEPDEIVALCKLGVPVLATAAPGDMDRIAFLLRAGVAEALVEPVDPDELARKVKRAARKATGQRSRAH